MLISTTQPGFSPFFYSHFLLSGSAITATMTLSFAEMVCYFSTEVESGFCFIARSFIIDWKRYFEDEAEMDQAVCK